MNVDNNSVPLDGICEGCLSVDRNLKSIFDAEIKTFFQSLIEPLICYPSAASENHALTLCWECSAIIRRMIKYQKQVRKAQEQLARVKLHHTTLPPCFSALSVHTPLPEITIKLDEAPPSPRVTRQTAVQEMVEPLAFIKVEQDDDDNGADLEGYYVGDDREGDVEDVDDKDLKAVLKSDPFNKEDKNKVKRRSKKKTEEFDDSDDEPLKKRTKEKLGEKNGVEGKKRGRRKKKGDSESRSTKLTRPVKRERPAGVVSNPRVARKLDSLNVPEGQLEMVLLSWEQVEEERQKALVSPSYTRHAHRCELCALGFNHRVKLDNHMRKHDPAAGPLQCAICRIRCRHAHALGAHRRRHRLRWRCTVCGATWSRAEVAADHCARAHGAAPPTHTCALCGDTAPSLGKLRNHLKNHSERQKCELCGKTFRDRASLRTHLFIHKGEKEYSCPRCEKRFLFKKAMEVHLVTHEAPAHLYCHQCDVNFKNRMSYYQHMKYNLKHIDPAMLKYACPLCDKKFAKASRLLEHNIAVHLKATPVACTVPDCAFACSSRPVLRTHIRMVHRNLRAVRNHVCHTCGKAYATKKTLEGHLRTHTGERPYACAHCPSTFAYAAALYNHTKRVHAIKGNRRVATEAPQPEVSLPR